MPRFIALLWVVLTLHTLQNPLFSQANEETCTINLDDFSALSQDPRAIKSVRGGLAAFQRKDFQHSLYCLEAALTYDPSTELNQQIRDMISCVETNYRKSLTYQRNRARQMELSNELALYAMRAWDQGKSSLHHQFLAIQLAHWACKISKNENVLALQIRKNYIAARGIITDPPSSEDLHAFITTTTNDSAKARLLICRPSSGKNEENTDTLDLDLPPIVAHSSHSHASKSFLAITADQKTYWINYETGQTQALQSNETVTSVALWQDGSHYALGYESGFFEIFDQNDSSIFKQKTAGAVNYLAFSKFNSNKKGKYFEFFSLSQPIAVFWKIKLKQDKKPDVEAQNFANDFKLAHLSPDKKKFVGLTNKNGIRFFNGEGKPTGEIHYPFLRLEGLSFNSIFITQENKSLIVKYSQISPSDSSTVEHTEEIGMDGSIQKQSQKTDKKNELARSDFKKLPELLQDVSRHKTNARSIRFFNKGSQFASLATNGGLIQVSDTKPFVPRTSFVTDGSEKFTSLAPDPLGRFVLASTDTNLVYLLSLSSGTSKTKISSLKKPARAIATSPLGDYFLCSEDTTVHLFSLDGGSPKNTYRFTAPVTAIATSPSGDTIAVGLADGNVLYVHRNNTQGILASGLGRNVGTVQKVAFSKQGKKMLVISKDKSTKKAVLDIVNNDPADITADRRYYYESPDEINIQYAEFSNDGENILLTRKNETILLSAKFLKPEYTIQQLKSPHSHDEIREAYLIENNQFIATLSFSGDLGIQRNAIDILDREMQELSLLELIRYKVAEPDSIRKYAATREELDKSIEYLAAYNLDEDTDKDNLRNIQQHLLETRIQKFADTEKDSNYIANLYFALAQIYEERSLEQSEVLEPAEALTHQKQALRNIQTAWQNFKNRPDLEKKQAEEAMCRIYNEMAWLNICNGSLSLAKTYADSSDFFQSALPACPKKNLSNRAILLLLEGKTAEAYRIHDQFQNEKCSDQKGNETMREVFVSDLSYLSLLEKSSISAWAKKNNKNTLDSALKRLKK